MQLREPVNKFPDFVRHVVQRLKALCPTMGKVKIAQTLARAGLTMPGHKPLRIPFPKSWTGHVRGDTPAVGVNKRSAPNQRV